MFDFRYYILTAANFCKNKKLKIEDWKRSVSTMQIKGENWRRCEVV